METNDVVNGIDMVILVTFCIEWLFKMLSEGLAPWRFFTGSEWRWNNFDAVIIVMCMPGLMDDFPVAILRLLRLMRLAKLVRKVPALQMIIMGLVGGLGSIGYILLLLFLVFYLFAIAGIYAFRDNDPFHWGDLFTALLTLFRGSTLEDWTDLMYTSMYGCAKSPSWPVTARWGALALTLTVTHSPHYHPDTALTEPDPHPPTHIHLPPSDPLL